MFVPGIGLGGILPFGLGEGDDDSFDNPAPVDPVIPDGRCEQGLYRTESIGPKMSADDDIRPTMTVDGIRPGLKVGSC